MENYYSILLLDVSASADQIKSSYRSIVKIIHPDKHSGSPAAEEMFKRVQAAYEILSDQKRKQSYDQGYKIYQEQIRKNQGRHTGSWNDTARRIYNVTFEVGFSDILNNNSLLFQNYLIKENAIESWHHHMTNSFIIVVNNNITAANISSFIKQRFPKKRFLVSEINVNNNNGWLHKNTWEWLKQFKYQPQSS